MKHFCHLHTHNEFSFLDGLGTAKQYVRRAKELGFGYLALTNHGNVDGLIKFQAVCDEEKIKPVLGAELYIVPDMKEKKKGEKRGHITLLVKDEIGWRNLLRLVTIGNLEGFYNRPRIDYKSFMKHCQGLVVMTACVSSFLNMRGGQDFFLDLKDEVGDDLYLEIMPHDIKEQISLNFQCLDLAEKYGVLLVATNDCHYVMEDDVEAQEVLLAIGTQAKWNDIDRFKFGLTGLHLRTADEMEAAFDVQEFPYTVYSEAMKETVAVARKCGDFRIKKREISLPIHPELKGLDENEFLRNLCNEKLKEKGLKEKEYGKRLDRELDLICEKGFAPYFLIVWDLMSWCWKSDIMSGPGRGSVGGSLVAYLLGIIQIDPVKFNLPFERFIAQDRIDYPDIDIDFEDTKKDMIRDRLRELYGGSNVAGINTHLRMKNRAVIRDVSRVFDVPLGEAGSLAKTIDDTDDLKDVFKKEKVGKIFEKKYPQVVRNILKLRGQIRGLGQHPAGVIISSEDISSNGRAALSDKDGTLMINWDGEDAEFVGLVKFDLLSLKEISVLAETKRLIEQNVGRDIHFEDDIPLDDNEVLKDISEGNTVGCFQLAQFTTELIKKMGVEKFSHISDAVALARPGPMNSGMTKKYVDRKHGRKWEAMHPLYEEATKDTYGVIVYQEQVMEVINKVAGLDYSTADKIRKIIGKKRDVKEFKQFYAAFVDGCLKNKTLNKKEAADFWKGMEKHAGYSFNRAHSVEYAMMAYWTAWLKHYYPTEFLCGSLSCGAEGKKDELVDEAMRLGLKIIPPKVGKSDAFKWMARGRELYVPFVEVKGIGKKTAETAASVGIEKKKRPGFFLKKVESVPAKGKLGVLLQSIGAFSDDIPKGISEYFDFDIGSDLGQYPRLETLTKGVGKPLRELLRGEVEGLELGKKLDEKTKGALADLRYEMLSCSRCSLRDECDGPVGPSIGTWNMMICGEGAGKDENQEGEVFIGRAGKELWKIMAEFKLKRKLFYISNVDKCWPSETKTPTKEHIAACRGWLDKEIEILKPFLILSLGNIPRYYFTGEISGINSVSGTTEWNERAGAWICYSTHPASVLHRKSEGNVELFRKGIENFSEKLETLGGI